MFVSLRRRELKYSSQIFNCIISSSSPYGDVSWNKLHVLLRILSKVRLLAETRVEMPNNGKRGNLSDTFVSLRRRELKYHWIILHKPPARSSPCGDVNWNVIDISGDISCMIVRLLTETWVEITLPSFDILVNVVRLPGRDASWNHKVFRVLHNLHRSSPYGDVSWNRASSPSGTPTICSSPCGDVSWNIATGAFLYESS